MDIRLKSTENKNDFFYFPALPESIGTDFGENFATFDIATLGEVKLPTGANCDEISWSGEFFGKSKKKERIVRTKYWKEPVHCVKKLKKWMHSGEVLTLIVSNSWINLDVIISDFQAEMYGAFGNIRYTIKFTKYRDLTIYKKTELKGNKKSSTTNAKNNKQVMKGRVDTKKKNTSQKTYTIKDGDTLWAIATKKCGGGSNWTKLYDKNKSTIEKAAKSHGRKDSDKGHWIYPGTKLIIP